ncbi:metalloendopeptidase OMA1 [Skeletonema marinoi]|uniref:Metalloendopeptidase OMA1 n=1 Tax=Skeletonema marinoi TaxID=267567 RepID=A0AAD9DFH5_9STRA|nr:metalloendopeptidase OMA1 [Skeletonema marinoi]
MAMVVQSFLLTRSTPKLAAIMYSKSALLSSSAPLLHRHCFRSCRSSLQRRTAQIHHRFSTTSSSPVNKSPVNKDKWRQIARIAYYIRIPVLTLSIYGIGYQQGIMDFAREKEIMEAKLLQTVLAGVGCTSPEDLDMVLIAHEGEDWRIVLSRLREKFQIFHSDDMERYKEHHHRMVMLRDVAKVGEKIIKVARSYVKSKLAEVVRDAVNQLPPEVQEDEKRLYEALEQIEEVALWTKATRHMEGDTWKFVLIPSVIPNAFVSEILPHRIFITTSMIETFIKSDDELALTLGHEVSHLILGHSSNRNSFEVFFRTAEILVLSLDPTEGLLSLAFMAFLASLRHAIGAEFSRNDEREADELGIKLCAMACFDTKSASHVFHRMHLADVESGKQAASNRAGLLSFFDSHPPSEERYHSLLEESGKKIGKIRGYNVCLVEDYFS